MTTVSGAAAWGGEKWVWGGRGGGGGGGDDDDGRGQCDRRARRPAPPRPVPRPRLPPSPAPRAPRPAACAADVSRPRRRHATAWPAAGPGHRVVRRAIITRRFWLVKISLRESLSYGLGMFCVWNTNKRVSGSIAAIWNPPLRCTGVTVL